jgi:hypothetical protein
VKAVEAADWAAWKKSMPPGPKETPCGSTWKGTARPSRDSLSEPSGIARRPEGKTSSNERPWRPGLETWTNARRLGAEGVSSLGARQPMRPLPLAELLSSRRRSAPGAAGQDKLLACRIVAQRLWLQDELLRPPRKAEATRLAAASAAASGATPAAEPDGGERDRAVRRDRHLGEALGLGTRPGKDKGSSERTEASEPGVPRTVEARASRQCRPRGSLGSSKEGIVTRSRPEAGSAAVASPRLELDEELAARTVQDPKSRWRGSPQARIEPWDPWYAGAGLGSTGGGDAPARAVAETGPWKVETPEASTSSRR